MSLFSEIKCSGKNCPLSKYCERYLIPHKGQTIQHIKIERKMLSPCYNDKTGKCTEIIDTRNILN